MPLPTELNQNTARELRKQLDEDGFFKQLSNTTLFHNIQPTRMTLTALEELSQMIEIEELPQKEVLKIDGSSTLYEIISGYVKIYDRKLKGGEKGKKPIKNPPALLAWRVPGDLLGDFQFALPEMQLIDHIEATDNCALLKISTATVRNLAQQYPQIYLNIARNLAAKAVKTRIRAQILRLPNIECMIAKMFIELIAERDYDQDINRKENLKVLNGTFYVEDIAAFLGYEYHRTQTGVRSLIKARLLAHYQHNKSGRFSICEEQMLHTYLEHEQLK
jgi:CRP-like cAMP-binding protein